jgi:hypothetical protein
MKKRYIIAQNYKKNDAFTLAGKENETSLKQKLR